MAWRNSEVLNENRSHSSADGIRIRGHLHHPFLGIKNQEGGRERGIGSGGIMDKWR